MPLRMHTSKTDYESRGALTRLHSCHYWPAFSAFLTMREIDTPMTVSDLPGAEDWRSEELPATRNCTVLGTVRVR